MMAGLAFVADCAIGAGPAEAGTPNSVKAPPIAVETHTLKNGLKILIHEDHSIPTVASYIFYRIGSRNEGPGTTGLSHFFEPLYVSYTRQRRLETEVFPGTGQFLNAFQ